MKDTKTLHVHTATSIDNINKSCVVLINGEGRMDISISIYSRRTRRLPFISDVKHYTSSRNGQRLCRTFLSLVIKTINLIQPFRQAHHSADTTLQTGTWLAWGKNNCFCSKKLWKFFNSENIQVGENAIILSWLMLNNPSKKFIKVMSVFWTASFTWKKTFHLKDFISLDQDYCTRIISYIL